jgi:hypothetical protein
MTVTMALEMRPSLIVAPDYGVRIPDGMSIIGTTSLSRLLDQLAVGIIDHYESLIDDGKLRVVEEMDSTPTRVGVTMSAKCSACGLKPMMFDFAYCPGCGGRIKRA